MLVLLPPSEGKTPPRRGRPLDPAAWPEELRGPRTQVVDALVRLCDGDPDAAAEVLRLGPEQRADVDRDAALWSAPTARADAVYSGVLYDALDLATLTGPARRRATRWVGIVSSVFGLLRPDERIPAYRLEGSLALPDLPGSGKVAAHWRSHLDPVVRARAGDGLVVDLRSGTYAAFWRPGPDLAPRVAGVRVLHESGGRRTVVSHFNKATKGRLARLLLTEGCDARTPTDLAAWWQERGWHVELGEPGRHGQPLDVVVTEV